MARDIIKGNIVTGGGDVAGRDLIKTSDNMSKRLLRTIEQRNLWPEYLVELAQVLYQDQGLDPQTAPVRFAAWPPILVWQALYAATPEQQMRAAQAVLGGAK